MSELLPQRYCWWYCSNQSQSSWGTDYGSSVDEVASWLKYRLVLLSFVNGEYFIFDKLNVDETTEAIEECVQKIWMIAYLPKKRRLLQGTNDSETWKRYNLLRGTYDSVIVKQALAASEATMK